MAQILINSLKHQNSPLLFLEAVLGKDGKPGYVQTLHMHITVSCPPATKNGYIHDKLFSAAATTFPS